MSRRLKQAGVYEGLSAAEYTAQAWRVADRVAVEWSKRCAPPERPLHLLLLEELSAHNLVDRRFNKCRADPFTLSPSRAIVWNKLAVVLDVGVELDCVTSQRPVRNSLIPKRGSVELVR
jgi:hypothetical protein